MTESDVGAVSPTAERAARAAVESLGRAFNAHDPVALSENFAEEAAWSTVMGQRLGGRREIADFGREVMPRLKD